MGVNYGYNFAMRGILPIIMICIIVFIVKRKKQNTRKVSNKQVDLDNKTNSQNQVVKNYTTAYKKEYLLTVNEKHQYWQIRRWADAKNLIVFTKVRLADLISPRYNSNDNKTLFWKIQAKHVDFVICDERINVVCIIELQDNSHQRTDRIERDKFVREVLESCGYRVIQTFNVTADLLDKTCGYYKEETEIRHDPTDHSE